MNQCAHPLWGITAYFNASRYHSKLVNYRIFRNRLTIPLITVELSYDDKFELTQHDASILVQIRGHSVMWQRERLLNVALQHLPPEVNYVAWLDCDIIFTNPQWCHETVELLQRFPVVQPFSQVFDLGRNELPEDVDTAAIESHSLSMAHKLSLSPDAFAEFRPSTLKKRRGLGFTWAFHRSLMRKHQFYDAMILGSGDRTLIYAAYGKWQDAIESTDMNSSQERHYLAWAKPFFEDVRSQVSWTPGDLFHLWHGDLVHRRYQERHEELVQFDFDPYCDIASKPSGCWEWTSRKPALHEFVRRYFSGRREDG